MTQDQAQTTQALIERSVKGSSTATQSGGQVAGMISEGVGKQAAAEWARSPQRREWLMALKEQFPWMSEADVEVISYRAARAEVQSVDTLAFTLGQIEQELALVERTFRPYIDMALIDEEGLPIQRHVNLFSCLARTLELPELNTLSKFVHFHIETGTIPSSEAALLLQVLNHTWHQRCEYEGWTEDPVVSDWRMQFLMEYGKRWRGEKRGRFTHLVLMLDGPEGEVY